MGFVDLFLTDVKSVSPKRECLRNALEQRHVAEFFAGIGLMREGLERQGWKVVYANDIDPEKKQMYQGHFKDKHSHFVQGDIHKIKADSIPDIALATASFPCNDLSLAGMRQGLEGKQSSAYWGFVKILEKMKDRRPPLVLLENVAGFLTSHGGADFAEALLALNRLGYAVDPMIIDAERFVPQSRVRLFIIASKTLSPAEEVLESPSFFEDQVRPKALVDFIFAHPEIIWSIRPVPPLPERTLALTDMLEDLPNQSPFWWNQERTDYLLQQMSERHSQQLDKMKKSRKWCYGTVFRRVRKGRSMAEMRTDGIAGCLRTPRGGSGRQILVKAGYGIVKARLLTPRECARLMGAENFNIDVPLNQALFGFGDAVCVPVVEWLTQNYLEPLALELLNSL